MRVGWGKAATDPRAGIGIGEGKGEPATKLNSQLVGHISSSIIMARLYVGNLSDSVDECATHSTLSPSPLSPQPAHSHSLTSRRYSLMQLCAKHGKIAKLDYLFHKAGPCKGRPRGYAFVQYDTSEVRHCSCSSVMSPSTTHTRR